MALFKILKGSQNQLGAESSSTRYAKEGYAYFATKTQNGETTGKMYIDIAGDGATPAEIGTNRIPLNAEKADYAENAKRDENGDRILVSYIKREKAAKQTIDCTSGGGGTALQLQSGHKKGSLIQFTGAEDDDGSITSGYLGMWNHDPVYYDDAPHPLVTIDVSEVELGNENLINADSLGGSPANDYLLKASAINLIYPVGSIYITFSEENPATLFGVGTWTKIEDKFLLGTGSQYHLNAQGGEATHKLSMSELPSQRIGHAVTSVSQSVSGIRSASSGSTASVVRGVSSTDNDITLPGGNMPHNNMPPYIAVNMWKRVE